MRALLLALVSLYSSQALAFGITLVGGLNFAAPNYSTSATPLTSSSSGAAAFGGFGSIYLRDGFEFESGLLYQNVSYSLDGNNSTTRFDFKELQIPFLLRYNIDERVGVGAGVYWGIGLGGVTTGTGATTQTTTFSNQNLYSNDFGLLLDVRARIALTELFWLALDGRYQLGLEERAKEITLNSYKTRSIQVLAGIGFDL